jgi:hypothetical protein
LSRCVRFADPRGRVKRGRMWGVARDADLPLVLVSPY